MTTYSDMITSDEIPSTYTTKLLQIGHETTIVPTTKQRQHFSTTRHPLKTSKFENLKSTTGPILLLDFRMMILIGLGILLSSSILIASLGFCIYRFKKRMADNNLNTEIYMDVATMSSMHALSAGSAYQDLNAPPKLPERRKSDVLVHHYESNIKDIKYSHDGDLEEIHEYADMKTGYQTPKTDKDFDIDGYLLLNTERPLNDRKSVSDKRNSGCTMGMKTTPDGYVSQGIKENVKHDYIQMKTVYQKPKTATDLDLDGYLLPNTTPSLSDDSVKNKLTRENNDKESNMETGCIGGEGTIPLPQDTTHVKKEIHKYMDMKTVYQKSATGNDTDLDGYLLPSAMLQTELS